MTREEWAIVQAPFAAPAIGALEAAVGREMRDLAEIEGHRRRLPVTRGSGLIRVPDVKAAGIQMLAAGHDVQTVARRFHLAFATVRSWREEAMRARKRADAAILSGGAG